MRVDGSRIQKEKVADSKISGYVWMGLKEIVTMDLLEPGRQHALVVSVYLSNRPQVSMGYRLINHAGCW